MNEAGTHIKLCFNNVVIKKNKIQKLFNIVYQFLCLFAFADILCAIRQGGNPLTH